MKIKIGSRIAKENPKNIYRITVDTMTGDADGWNDLELDFKDKEEFIKVVRYCEVMALQYQKCGRGGGDGFYDHLDFFEDYFNEEWYYQDGEWMDSWESFGLTYFDQTGDEFKVSYTLTDEDKEIIASYEVKQ